MKIYDSNLSGTSASETTRSQEVQRPERGDAGRSSPIDTSGDHVELSGTLGRLSRTISSFQSDRAGRVQALAAQYQAGNYQPDSMAISRGMVQAAIGAGAQ